MQKGTRLHNDFLEESDPNIGPNREPIGIGYVSLLEIPQHYQLS